MTLTERQKEALLELLDPTEVFTTTLLDNAPVRMLQISISAHLRIEPQFINHADQLLHMLRSTVIKQIDEKIAKAEEILNGK